MFCCILSPYKYADPQVLLSYLYYKDIFLTNPKCFMVYHLDLSFLFMSYFFVAYDL